MYEVVKFVCKSGMEVIGIFIEEGEVKEVIY